MTTVAELDIYMAECVLSGLQLQHRFEIDYDLETKDSNYIARLTARTDAGTLELERNSLLSYANAAMDEARTFVEQVGT